MHRFVSVRHVPALLLALFVHGAGTASAQESPSHPVVLAPPQSLLPPLIAAGPEPATAVLPLAPSALRAAMLPPAAAAGELDVTAAASNVYPRKKRPAAMIGLYASFAALQAFDAHSTARALDRGAVEANPLMRGIAGNTGGMLAIKAAGTAGVVYAGERLW